MFTCSGTGLGIGWYFPNATNTSIMGDRRLGHIFRTSRLSVLAIEENNNTAIECIMYKIGAIGGLPQRTGTLTIYG